MISAVVILVASELPVKHLIGGERRHSNPSCCNRTQASLAGYASETPSAVTDLTGDWSNRYTSTDVRICHAVVGSVKFQSQRHLIAIGRGGRRSTFYCRWLVQQRGRIPPRARSSRLAESECRHERWVGIKTLVFILQSTSLNVMYPFSNKALNNMPQNKYVLEGLKALCDLKYAMHFRKGAAFL